jgi:TfoX/Sxy family transcriptional regulator of competence genes
MKMPKSPPELVALFPKLVPAGPDIVRKQMFGYPSAVLRGRMFMSLFGPQLVLRLSDEDLARITEDRAAAPFEPMPGRPMRGFVAISERLWKDPAKLRPWIKRSLEHADAMPAKKPKKKPAPRRTK